MMADGARLRWSCRVNGEPVDVVVDGAKTLLEILREDLQLTGTKHGCELGECGACAVLLDDEPVLSCLVIGAECEGRRVTTVEGLAQDGRLHPLQEAFADCGAAQCGYCTPGILMTAKALLDREPHPSRERIREALSGNLCRCTGYEQIIDAVQVTSRHDDAGRHFVETTPGVVSPQGDAAHVRGSRSEKRPPASSSGKLPPASS
jgi:aerobic-type carbon monoxide dehydrogenase small subunit (CoxS/CutS family)